MIIAIDGPAGSGKTTLAQALSTKLNFFYLNTGATYRALTYAALENKVKLSDSGALQKLAGGLNLRVSGDKIYLDGKDISDKIRQPLIDKNISSVVIHPAVRKVMVELQRKIAAGGNFVVEGRDITTVVFPEAEYKFYIDAAPAIRAQRRFKELQEKGLDVSLREVREDLEKRDYADRNRKVSPLKISASAVYIDTTNLTIPEAVEAVAVHIRAKNN